MLVKTIGAMMLALTLCAGLRADDGCKVCEERKPKCDACDKCSTCEKVKRCTNPVKNFFVHDVGGTISSGFHFGCNTCKTCETPAPKADCGCGK